MKSSSASRHPKATICGKLHLSGKGESEEPATQLIDLLALSLSLLIPIRSLLSPGDNWCLCSKRWNEAVQASADHKLGDKIIPRVLLEATHEKAAEVIGPEGRALLLQYAAAKEEAAAETCEKTEGLQSGEKRVV